MRNLTVPRTVAGITYISIFIIYIYGHLLHGHKLTGIAADSPQILHNVKGQDLRTNWAARFERAIVLSAHRTAFCLGGTAFLNLADHWSKYDNYETLGRMTLVSPNDQIDIDRTRSSKPMTLHLCKKRAWECGSAWWGCQSGKNKRFLCLVGIN